MSVILYKFRSVIVLSVCLVISIWLSNKPVSGKLRFARGLQLTVMYPVHIVVAKVTAIRSTINEVGHLRRISTELTLENAEIKQALRENRELRDMLEYKQNSPIGLIPADIIAYKRDVATSYALIGVGTANGVEKNFPATTVDGVVGKVIEVHKFLSVVRLINDPASKVGIRFSRIDMPAIMECMDTRHGRVSFQKYAAVSIGDTVVTSGLGGLFPKGLFVGTVVRLEDGDDLIKIAIVDFHQRLTSMEHLFVLKIKDRWYPHD